MFTFSTVDAADVIRKILEIPLEDINNFI